MKKQMTARCAALALAACLLAGCAGGQSGSPAPSGGGEPAPGAQSGRPYEGVELTFLRHSGYDADWMAEKAAEFYEETGIRVTIEQVAYSEVHNKFVVDASSGGGVYDLFATTDYWLPEFYEGGWIADLTPYLSDPALADPEFGLEDISQPLLDGNSIDGKLLAFPWKFNSQMLAYRSDLMAGAPKDWEELLAAAKANQGGGTAGIALALGKASVMDIYLNALYQNGGSFIAADGKTCGLDSPQAAQALAFLMELQNYTTDGAINSHWDEAATLFSQGGAAMATTINTQAGNITDPEKSLVSGAVEFAELPGPVTACATSSTWGICVTQNCKNPEAAFLYIQYINQAARMRELVEGTNGSSVPVRSSLLTDPELMEKYPQFRVMNDIATLPGHTFAYPKSTQSTAIMEVLAGHVQNALLGTETAEAALAAAKREIEALL